MAGSIAKKPYPGSMNSTVSVVIGGHVLEGASALVVGHYTLDFDAYVESVRYSYQKTSTNDIDAVTLAASGAAAKTLVAAGDMSANILNVKQTLHADVLNHAYKLKAGDLITLSADASGTTEGGHFSVQIELNPGEYPR